MYNPWSSLTDGGLYNDDGELPPKRHESQIKHCLLFS